MDAQALQLDGFFLLNTSFHSMQFWNKEKAIELLVVTW